MVSTNDVSGTQDSCNETSFSSAVEDSTNEIQETLHIEIDSRLVEWVFDPVTIMELSEKWKLITDYSKSIIKMRASLLGLYNKLDSDDYTSSIKTKL